MITSKIIYKDGLSTEATHVRSSKTLMTDAPVDNNGQGAAFSPTDLVATAIGSCMLTIMGIRTQKEGIDLAGTQVEVTKIMASNPRRISEIKVLVQFPKGLEVTDAQKETLLGATKDCPVCNSLHPDLRVDVQVAYL